MAEKIGTVKISVIKIGDMYIKRTGSGKIIIFDEGVGFEYDPEEPECHVYMTNLLELIANGEVPRVVEVEAEVTKTKYGYLVKVADRRKALVKDLSEL